MRSDSHRGTIWGKKGETPEVSNSGGRFGLKLISTVTPRGDLRFQIIEGKMNSAIFTQFLSILHRDAGKPILVITDNARGNFKVGLRTEKSRLRRSLLNLQDLMRRMRHLLVREQVQNLNRVLRGHYAYYGIAGNLRALQKVQHAAERYWRKMLSSRSRKGKVTWENFQKLKERYPLQKPKLVQPYRELQALAVL